MRVIVVFDPDYGRQANADLGDGFWLVESPLNRALAARKWLADGKHWNSAVFDPAPHLAPDEDVLGRFSDADLHHFEWSEMKFVGAVLSLDLNRQFTELGLKVEPTDTGFILRR